MIDKGDTLALALLFISLAGALNWGIYAATGEGVFQMVLSDANNINLARLAVGASSGVIVLEAFGVTDIGYN